MNFYYLSSVLTSYTWIVRIDTHNIGKTKENKKKMQSQTLKTGKGRLEYYFLVL